MLPTLDANEQCSQGVDMKRFWMILPCLLLLTGSAAAEETGTDKIVNQFMELDTDASASVSWDEYMTMVQQRATERFQEMDLNQDGEVTDAEYREYWKTRKAQWYHTTH